MEKLEPLCIDGGNIKWCYNCWRQNDSSLIIKHTRIPNSTYGDIHKIIKSRNLEHLFDTNVYSYIIPNNQNVETTELSISRWMNKQKVVYTHKIHTIWVHLGNLVLKEMSRIQSTNIIWFHLFAVPDIVKFIDERKMVEDEGGRNRELLFNG